jgi:hypothetical protein
MLFKRIKSIITVNFGKPYIEVRTLKCNVGSTERIIRIIVGIIIVSAGIGYRSWWGLVGLAPITTGIIGWCPVSQLLGVSTCYENKVKR